MIFPLSEIWLWCSRPHDLFTSQILSEEMSAKVEKHFAPCVSFPAKKANIFRSLGNSVTNNGVIELK